MVRVLSMLMIMVAGCDQGPPLHENTPTPWALIGYSTMDGGSFVIGRFTELKHCQQYKDLLELPCKWETLEKQVLDCRGPKHPSPRLNCEKRKSR